MDTERLLTDQPAVAVAAPHRDRGVQVIERVADVLRALAGESQGLSLSEIAGRVGLARSTVHRLVVALEREEFVAPATPNGRVRLGPGLIRLGAASQPELLRELVPLLQQLSEEVAETVDLAVLDGAAVRFVDQVLAPQRLRAVSSIGESFPLSCTANGKALLAALDRTRAERLLPPRLVALTPNTITSREQLWQELDEVQRRGYAIDHEEHNIGISAVGATVSDANGVIAAVTVVVPTPRFSGNEQWLAERLLDTCARASRVLGVSP
jgi:DNA-binding IclR family transcriptional regulator